MNAHIKIATFVIVAVMFAASVIAFVGSSIDATNDTDTDQFTDQSTDSGMDMVYLNVNAGDDINDGTFNNPVKTLSIALSKVSSGGTIMVTGDLQHSVRDINKPVTIKGDGDERVSLSGSIQIPAVSGKVRFENLSFKGSSTIGTYGESLDYSGLSLEIVNCAFTNAGGNCVYIQPEIASLTVTGCEFAVPEDLSNYSQQYLIWPYEVGTITITDNTFDGLGLTRGAIHLGNGSSSGTKVTVCGNTIMGFERAVTVALKNSASNTVLIDDNIFENIAISEQTNTDPRHTATVYIHSVATSGTTVVYTNNDLTGTSERIVYNDNRFLDADKIITTFNNNRIGEDVVDDLSDSSYDYNVAAIGDIKYESLSEAITGATEGSEIILLNDVDESVTFDNNSTVSLNLNGFDITSSGTTISVSTGTTLTITGTGTIDSGNHDNWSIRNNGGTVIFDTNSDVICLDEILNDGNGTMNIRGIVDTNNNDISNRHGSGLNIYGTIYGAVSNFGTTTLYDGCKVYLADINNTTDGSGNIGKVVLSEDCNNTHNIFVSYQDEVDIGGNAILKAYSGRGSVITQGQSVIITVEGSTDRDNPYVYTIDDDNIKQVFTGTSLTIKAQDGTYATIELVGTGVTIQGNNVSSDNRVNVTFEGLTFTTGESSNTAEFRMGSMYDTTFTDCTFININLQATSNIGVEGTYTVTGCTFTFAESSYTNYAVNLCKANVVFIDNTVSGYQRGFCINTRDGGNERVAISGNTFSGINDESGGYAIQLTFESAGTEVDITNNTIDDCLYAVRVHDNGDETVTPESVKITENTIIRTPNGILYSAKDNDDSIRSDVKIDSNLNYFAPEGENGIPILVVTDSQTASTEGLVQCDEWYIEPSKTYTNQNGLMVPSVSIMVSDSSPYYGETVRLTATVSNPVKGATYTYHWSDGSDLDHIDVTSGGTYSVTVTVMYENLSETGRASVTVSFLFPDIGGSDDDVVLPPQIVYEDSDSGSDDTTTVVACAAAAVVAAILAVFLIMEYRRR